MFIYLKEFGAQRDIWAQKARTVDGRRSYTENLKSAFLTKYLSGDQIKKNEMFGQLARMGKGGGAYRTMLGTSVGRRLL